MINKDIIGISRDIEGEPRRIRVWPKDAAFLHKLCEEVTEFDRNLQQEVADMFATLDDNQDGVALAANQVGISKRMFVANIPMFLASESSLSPTAPLEYTPTNFSIVCINPEIIRVDHNRLYKYEEGCLSVPGYYETTRRPQSIVLRYYNLKGREELQEFQGFTAFAIQHEIEHLDGKLFIDGKSKLKMSAIRRKVMKRLR